MRISIVRSLVIVLGVLVLMSPLAAQSEEDCQRASKLHAEQEFIQQLFRNLGDVTHAAGGPALGSDPNSLQSRVRQGLSSCQSQGGDSNACGNYKRIRDAWLTNNTGSSPGAAMVTDPQTCEIENPDTGETVDAARKRPAGGFAQANWDSQYQHEQFHQANCRRLNGSGSNYQQGGPDSPYLEKMKDPRGLAEEEGFAHGITKDVLEDYLKDNCFDPALLLDAGDMTGMCGESPSAVAKIRSLANTTKTWVVNTANDWLNVEAFLPVETSPNGEAEVGLRGDCQCCDATTKEGKVRVYGGLGHSILIGQDDANMGCAKNNECAGLSGDPHMRTYDGLRFDFQGAGEFVLARGEGFEVQARMEAWHSRPVSLGTALAIQVNGDVVGFYIGIPPKLVVLGQERTVNADSSLRLPGGGLITRDRQRYRLTSPQGLVVEVHPSSTSINLKIGLPINTPSIGLLGNFDGDRANDLQSAAGSLLAQPIDFDSLYNVFGAGWRVTAETSLFDYATGESAATFHNPTFPMERVEARNITAANRRKAEAVCRDAGVVGPINIDDCILDVGLTGDAEFAKTAAEQPPDTARLEIRGGPSGATPSGSPAAAAPTAPANADGVTLDAPSEGIAADAVEIRVNEAAQRGYHVWIAPAGSASSTAAANPYSGRSLAGGEQVLPLVVPTIPGNYELRYIENGGERRILLKQPFRSIEPKIQIEASAFAEVGTPFDIRVLGDVGKHMYVTVVPKGSLDTTPGEGRARRNLRSGTDVSVKLAKLPEEPGAYEIRCSSNYNGGKQVYARRPLRAAAGRT